ncbi:MAG: hypothetical protein IPO07_28595 [Haliscomenobacter sp.]|nr:hypothetical protein [Haliscomenobacter sp.]MBK9492308.1 hypothetical protein [Haliscomenobacter sp.]
MKNIIRILVTLLVIGGLSAVVALEAWDNKRKIEIGNQKHGQGTHAKSK